MKRVTLALAILPCLLSNGRADEGRHSLRVGTQIPVQYAAGYECRLMGGFSANLGAGVLTYPYDDAILGVMHLFGVDDSLRSIIERGFHFGVIVGGGVKYAVTENNYIGASCQWVRLEGGGTAAELLGAYFNRDFSPLRAGGNRTPLELTLQSDLYLLGILYGRRFHLGAPNVELAVEVGVSKALSSRNVFESNRPRLDATAKVQGLYANLSDDLKSAYRDYAYVPTINFYLVWRPR